LVSDKPNEGATPIHPVMHIPVPWVFILVYLVGIAAQLVLPIHVRLERFAGSVRVAGLVLVAVGILVAFSAQVIFRRVHTTTIPFEKPSTFVTSGPYRFTRNPMYVGLTLIYVGVAGTRLEIWPVIVLPLLLAYLNFLVIPVEERRLSAVFGDAYHRYCASVRRWL
jgi:protein-S-isoprenylcysteine O-methyltransferase Ste14